MNAARIIYLFRAYFIENKKKLLICCLISFATLCIAYCHRAMPEFSPLVPYLITFWLAGTFFQYTLRKNNTPYYLSLPVTAGERFVHTILVLLVLGVIINLLALAGSYVGYYVIHPLFNTNMDEIRWIACGSPSTWNQHIMYLRGWRYHLIIFSAFLFGSIYFKKRAFWKTLICGTSFFIVIRLYYELLIFFIFGHLKPSAYDVYSLEFLGKIDTFHFLFNYPIFRIVLILFFLSLTFLRLKETEI